MNRYFNERSRGADGGGGGVEGGGGGQAEPAYHEFQGNLIVVDLAEINGQTEEFNGDKWLQWRVNERLHFGWDLEWQPDRTKETNNPISLMQFSDESTCLLLRTHRTGPWLPMVVMKALMSDACKKIGVGWDGPDKQKMQRTFNFEPLGIVDLSQIAQAKGIKETGLKSMSEYFGIRMRKEPKIARSNWACHQLSAEQQLYAAEDAYFSFILYEKLNSLPDAAREDPEGFAIINQGVLELQEGWEEEGIVRKHDGLHCAMCGKGPMLVPMVVQRHMEGAQHRKKLAMKNNGGKVQNNGGKVLAADNPELVPGELEEKYVINCIIAGDGIKTECKLGEYKCEICPAGPFNSLTTVDAHLGSKRHVKAMMPKPAQEAAAEAAMQKDPYAENLWNMPDYVEVVDGNLMCKLCEAKASAVVPMFMHLGGNQHAKKCRSKKEAEIIYVKQKGRLEQVHTGQPVVRTGFKMPRPAEEAAASMAMATKASASTAEVSRATPEAATASKNAAGAGTATTAREASATPPLPDGWEEHIDTATGRLFYFDRTNQVSQWERPAPPPVPAAQPPQSPQAQATAAAAQPAAAGGGEVGLLPPGWQQVWSEENDAWYYADIETQASQWKPPPAYVKRAWQRKVGTQGHATWTCSELSQSFLESESDNGGQWQRLVDQQNRIYWSNSTKSIRFFEDDFICGSFYDKDVKLLYHIKREGEQLILDEGNRYGELLPDGPWLVATVMARPGHGHCGLIRLRHDGPIVVSNFKQNDGECWGPDTIARKSCMADAGVAR